jgi:hypothetical protein
MSVTGRYRAPGAGATSRRAASRTSARPQARPGARVAPKGNRNVFQHGRYRGEAVFGRRKVAALIRAMRSGQPYRGGELRQRKANPKMTYFGVSRAPTPTDGCRLKYPLTDASRDRESLDYGRRARRARGRKVSDQNAPSIGSPLRGRCIATRLDPTFSAPHINDRADLALKGRVVTKPSDDEVMELFRPRSEPSLA